ncbi:MAG: hypothetical protein ACYSU0_21215 [Planctomycetota bacterium]|jgi:hypothetical protein
MGRGLAVAFLVVWELSLLGFGVVFTYQTVAGVATLSGSSGEPVSAGGYALLAVVWLLFLAFGVLLFLVLRRTARLANRQLDALCGEPSDGSDAEGDSEDREE